MGASATLIGGILSYIGSWKIVYFSYGIAELVIAFLLLFVINKVPITKGKSGFFKAYSATLKNEQFLLYLIIVILTGYCVFGAFSFTGELIRELSSNNVLIIGIILSLFGLGGLFGSKIASMIRSKIGNKICLVGGFVGFLSLLYLALGNFIPVLAISFLGFGISFIFIHSTMIMASQGTNPSLRGTIMSLVSFSVFIGSSVGTIVNRKIIENFGMSSVFTISAIIIMILSVSAFYILNSNKASRYICWKAG